MKIPRQVLVKAGLDFTEASRLLKKCEKHPTSGTIYTYFIMNNLSSVRENYGLYAKPVGKNGTSLDEYTDKELLLD